MYCNLHDETFTRNLSIYCEQKYFLHKVCVRTCIIAVTFTGEIQALRARHDVHTATSVITWGVEHMTCVHFTTERATVGQVTITSEMEIIIFAASRKKVPNFLSWCHTKRTIGAWPNTDFVGTFSCNIAHMPIKVILWV